MKEIRPEINENLVMQLEDLLEEAKSGRLQGLAFCGYNDDATTFNGWAQGFRPVTMLGEIRLLERDVVDCCVDIRKNVADWACE